MTTNIRIDKVSLDIFKPPVNRIPLKRGDSHDITFTVNTDISLWDFRAELWDNLSSNPPSGEIHSITKQSAGVSGGSDTEISVDASAQEFTLHITAGDTSDFRGDVQLEIEINTNESGNNQVFTIYQDYVKFTSTKI